ncbi:30S ribosomal protein S1 isoform X1 [Triticum aestivum]|uniref:30S ribosomal protein S1 isoform X1 n=1 Tax=Triticum aestivum TaxID=4565 RepID=UPI001D0262C3|nr:30S ribosomal protein S1-like isoform X1 [Triticum aestivum]
MLSASLKPPPSLPAISPSSRAPALPAASFLSLLPSRGRVRLSAAASEGATVSQEDAASVSAAFEEARLAQFAADWKAVRADKDQGKILTLPVLRSNTGGLILKYNSMQGFVPNPLLSPAHWSKDPKRPIQDVTKDLVGSSVSVKVVEANEAEKKLVFSEKDASWSMYSSQVKIGGTYDGIVGSVFHYGAFVHLRFPDGKYHLTGLVHISEVSWDLVQDVQDFLTEGDIVKVIVVNVDAEKSRIGLSIRQLEEDPLLETLDKIIPLEPDLSPDAETASSPPEIELLPGLDGICNELLQEDGITDVRFGRQALEKRVVSQDLELWLSSVCIILKHTNIITHRRSHVTSMVMYWVSRSLCRCQLRTTSTSFLLEPGDRSRKCT